MINTNWTTPKTNFIAGINALRLALAAGMNARLIKMRNEDCAYPIREKQHNTDFRNYKFSSGTPQTRQDVIDDKYKTDFQKHLTLNYRTCYGTPEAVKRYYKTGLLSKDNIKGQGRSHLVKVKDLVPFMISIGDAERAKNLKEQYLTLEICDEMHFYDNFSLETGSEYAVKYFNKKLWVVELLDDDAAKPRIPILVHVINVLAYPLKYVPKKSVLKMDDYKCVTFRVGDVTNGIAVEFHVPKRFSFK